MSAVSKTLMPESRHKLMRRLASSTPVEPQALKNSLPPPKVPVPKHNAETLSPESPSILYSIKCLLSLSTRPLAPIFAGMPRAGVSRSKRDIGHARVLTSAHKRAEPLGIFG